MNSSTTKATRTMAKTIRAKRVRVTDARLTVDFNDGRTISVPTEWYPRLHHGTPSQRAKVEIWDDGILWPELNADVSYTALLLGTKSGESRKSFNRWLGYHSRGEKEPIPTLPLPPALAAVLKHGRKRSRRPLAKSDR